jgi:hypothetical protein
MSNACEERETVISNARTALPWMVGESREEL